MSTKQEALKQWALSKVGCGYIWGATGYVLTQSKLDAVIKSQGAESMAAKYGKKWLGKQCYDCAQLVRWGLNTVQVEGVNISGASSQWNKGKWIAKGTLDTIPEGQVCILYREDDGSNPMGHTGIALGDGTVVHAQGTKTGVVHTKISAGKWTHWAMPDFTGEVGLPEPEPATATLKTLRRGDKGEEVTTMQKELLNVGMALPKHGADGDFGQETEEAVKAFQQAKGLTADGICGPKTWTALTDVAPSATTDTYKVTITGLTKEQAEELTSKWGGTSEKEAR